MYYHKQAALVLAACGYSLQEIVRARLDTAAVGTYTELANNQPLKLQSFTEVYTKAVSFIPNNLPYSLLFRIDCKCARCVQPSPIAALPIHDHEDENPLCGQPFAETGNLIDLTIAHAHQELGPRNDTCTISVKSFPINFCVPTQKIKHAKFLQACRTAQDLDSFLENTVRVMRHTYVILGLVLCDRKAQQYLVVHHVRTQQDQTIVLYDSIYGVRHENVWSTLSHYGDLVIEAVHIRSTHLQSLHPSTSLQASLPEILRLHAPSDSTQIPDTIPDSYTPEKVTPSKGTPNEGYAFKAPALTQREGLQKSSNLAHLQPRRKDLPRCED